MKNKIIKINQLKKLIKKLKSQKKKIVHCHGVFDILHIGHAKHFKKAKELGDVLIVTITSDKYVKKGLDRPFFSHDLRLELLSELIPIDYLCLSDYEDSLKMIQSIKPNYYVKGNDYK